MSLISKRSARLAEIDRTIADRRSFEAYLEGQNSAPGFWKDTTNLIAELLAEVGRLDREKETLDPNDDPNDEERVSPAEALQALHRIGEELKIVAQVIAEKLIDHGRQKAPADNAGLPCLYCGEKLERVKIERVSPETSEKEELVDVRVSSRMKRSDLSALRQLLRSFY